jgi:hypothetical protein
VKPINKKAVEHNLALALKKAMIGNDIPGLHKAAQDIFQSGYEIEDMKIAPFLLEAIMNALVQTGWVPILTDAMKK